MGAGVRRKLVIADNFLIQGKLYPYIGLCQSNTPKNIEIGQEAEDKTKFTYGVSADVSVGLKLWNTAKEILLFYMLVMQLWQVNLKPTVCLKVVA